MCKYVKARLLCNKATEKSKEPEGKKGAVIISIMH